MSAKKLEADIARVRKEIAEQEAVLGGLKEKLAKLLNQHHPEDQKAVSGLEALWKAALPLCRQRSSKKECRLAWHKLKPHERPTIEVAVAALKKWNQCEQWAKDRNAYVPGLHRFITNCMWEDVPAVSDPLGKYRSPKPAAPAPKPEEIASAEDVSAILGGFSRRNRSTETQP